MSGRVFLQAAEGAAGQAVDGGNGELQEPEEEEEEEQEVTSRRRSV
jgi:hypothetical protein